MPATKPHLVGWTLDPGEREKLIERFPPRYPDVVAHHVTLNPRADASTPLPPERSGTIVGEAEDGEGVQALVVAIGGGTDRPGGGTYHITWSLDKARGRRAVESNEVIARLGWQALAEPVALSLQPAFF